MLSAPESGVYKPDARAYRYGLSRAGVDEAWFVAGHWWDVAGAAAAGLRTAWVSRTDLAYPVAMPQPDVRGADVAGSPPPSWTCKPGHRYGRRTRHPPPESKSCASCCSSRVF